MMNLLIDTHVFLWWDQRDPQLSARVKEMLADPAHEIFVSAASIWEIAIKQARGKLSFSGSPSEAIAANGFRELPIQALDAERAGGLDWDHADPLDRMLVAQADRAAMTLISADRLVLSYGRIPMMAAG